MPVDLDDQLSALGGALLRDSAPIAVDELCLDDVVVRHRDSAPLRSPARRWAAAAAMATAAAAVVGVVAIGPADGDTDLSSRPQAAVPDSEGVLVADPATAGGWALRSAVANRDRDGNRTVIYATSSATPDDGPSLVLTTPVALTIGSELPAGAMEFSLTGVTQSWWWSTSELDMSVAFERDGVSYIIDAAGVTEDQLRLAAEHVLPADDAGGARIDPAGLPVGVVERASGTMIESWFFDQAAVGRDLPQLIWTDEAGRPMWLTVAHSDVDLVALARIGRSSVTDVEVRGANGVALQDHDDNAFRAVVWAEGDTTYFLGARDVATDEMLGFAATLRPATAEEWAALVGDEETPANPQLVGVTSFPMVDAASVGLADPPDATFASRPSSADGVQAWQTVLGRKNSDGHRDVAVVDIVTGLRAPNANGRVDTSVTEHQGFVEYVFDTGDVRVAVQADVPADTARLVSTSVAIGGGGPPEIAGLPADLATVVEPFPVSADAGHFPVLAFEGVTIAVQPTPAAGLAARPGGALTPVMIAGRRSYVSDDGSGLIDIASELDDGAALNLSAAGMSMEQVVAIAEAVQLVDQPTWIARYQPRWVDETGATADLPAPLSMPATTVAEPSETLRVGDSGERVMAVQEMLTNLGFDPGPADGEFGTMTEQAVWAFEKLVMGVPREQATGAVTPEVWDRIGSAVVITPRRPQGPGVDHVEIYLPEQVMVVFRSDAPALITHISTGEFDAAGKPARWCETVTIDTDAAGNPIDEPVEQPICGISKTPGGIFDVDRLVRGTRLGPLGAMWNPIYFNYGIAIHGARNVPLEPASHGNVRVPMHVSEYLPDLIPVGTEVYVWNGVKEPEQQTREDELPVFDFPDPAP